MMLRAALLAVLITGALSVPKPYSSGDAGILMNANSWLSHLLKNFTDETGGTAEIGKWSDSNSFVDHVLEKVNAKLKPKIRLPDRGTFLHLKHCYMYGLEKGINRVGNATKKQDDDTLHVKTKLAVELIGAQCDWHFRNHSGTLGGHTKHASMLVQISVPIDNSDDDEIPESREADSSEETEHPQLDEFHMRHLGKLRLDVTGAGVLNNLAGNVFGWVVNHHLHKKVKSALDLALPLLIQKELDHVTV